MQRVMILGQPGSGKSTLARQLAAATGLPRYHMDHLHWLPDLQPRPLVEKTAMAHAIEARDRWIFEGGFSTTYDSRLARVDTVVWLDLPVGLRLWRVTMRMIRFRGQSRPDLPEGCFEGWLGETLDFYRYIWRTRHSARGKLQQLLARARRDQMRFHLRDRDQVSACLSTLEGRA